MDITQIICPTHQFKSLIQQDVSLFDKNWFATGGSARYYAEPSTNAEFQQALHFANTYNLPIFILGSGANILISDAGFNGLVIRPQLKQIQIQTINQKEALVRAGASVTMDELIEYCLNNQLGNLEEFSGIPGTVGGAVYINLHYFEFLLEHFLIEAHIIEKSSGSILCVNKDWFRFGYNQSQLQEENFYILETTFLTKHISSQEVAFAQGRRKEIIRHRASRYPKSHTCGSFFRNFFPHEVTLEINGKKMIYVAYYLDKIGVKGVLSYGGAIVSYQHANMIVNQKNATSNDIIQLARAMQHRVYEAFNILPQPECRLIGFNPYPLIK